MAISPNILDRDKAAYKENTLDGGLDRRVTDVVAQDILGDIRDNGIDSVPSGLATAGKITEVVLNSATWTAVPVTALTNRNGLGIQNPSSIQIRLNFDNAEPGYIGWSVNAQGEFFIDIRDNVILYAKSQSGTPTITVMEVS